MRAMVYRGPYKIRVENKDDPGIEHPDDAIVRVSLAAICGSDLHLYHGMMPDTRVGTTFGHEFVGEVVEVGPSVTGHKVGDRVVVSSFIACGKCWYCQQELYSCCDNSNTNPAVLEGLWGFAPGGCFGYSHALGGNAGSHAQYIRVPFADVGAFTIPDEVSYERALFASDSVSTGWTGADLGGVTGGDVVAVWGAGAVGQMAARAATLLGAEKVVVIDRLENRLAMTEKQVGVDVLNYEKVNIGDALLEYTGGRGPDVCIEAVGMEAHTDGPQHVYDQVKQQLRLQTDRPIAVREAIYNCRKGGSVFVLGVFAGFVDKFPLGAMMNKGLTVRGAQMHAPRYLSMILERMARGEIVPEYLATHVMPLDEAPHGYDIFKNKEDNCVRAVFLPNG
jgi:threonine dehydrogenase-like Zn-dependent dehydrogenase